MDAPKVKSYARVVLGPAAVESGWVRNGHVAVAYMHPFPMILVLESEADAFPVCAVRLASPAA